MKYTRFGDIPQLTRDGEWQCNFPLADVWRQVGDWVKGTDGDLCLDLNPDFQRAHVWTEAQQIAWIEFILRGGKTGRVLYLNHPRWARYNHDSPYAEFVVVDGKQRIEAIRRFVENEIPVFGSHYREYTDNLRLTRTMLINVNNLQSRAAVLQWYLEFNAGGTPHTDAEIQRVRELLEAEKGGSR
jgi:hypothetical protein